MRGGRKQARQARVVTEVRAALSEFAVAMEARVEAEIQRSRRTQLVLIQAIQRLHDDIDRRDDAIAQSLTTVARAIDRGAERMEAERHEHRALTDAMSDLADALSAAAHHASLLRGERLLGGRVESGTARAALDEIVLEPPAENGNGDSNGNGNGGAHEAEPVNGDAVCCLLDGTWVDGFEVVAVVRDPDMVRYRLRRCSDGSVLRRLFDAGEVRAPEVGRADAKHGRPFWSRS